MRLRPNRPISLGTRHRYESEPAEEEAAALQFTPYTSCLRNLLENQHTLDLAAVRHVQGEFAGSKAIQRESFRNSYKLRMVDLNRGMALRLTFSGSLSTGMDEATPRRNLPSPSGSSASISIALTSTFFLPQLCIENSPTEEALSHIAMGSTIAPVFLVSQRAASAIPLALWASSFALVPMSCAARYASSARSDAFFVT
jgi:hypothetical protein